MGRLSDLAWANAFYACARCKSALDGACAEGYTTEGFNEGTRTMKFGYFDDLNREYVITQPDTPLPWINYLGCQAYFGIISNTAGGYSFYRDARLRRLTRYRYNNVPMDFGGRYIYLRDDESKEFWSPSWQPTRHDLKDYTCRHGMGYTTIGSEYAGIEAHTRYFVPLDENLDVECHQTFKADEPFAAVHVGIRRRVNTAKFEQQILEIRRKRRPARASENLPRQSRVW